MLRIQACGSWVGIDDVNRFLRARPGNDEGPCCRRSFTPVSIRDYRTISLGSGPGESACPQVEAVLASCNRDHCRRDHSVLLLLALLGLRACERPALDDIDWSNADHRVRQVPLICRCPTRSAKPAVYLQTVGRPVQHAVPPCPSSRLSVIVCSCAYRSSWRTGWDRTPRPGRSPSAPPFMAPECRNGASPGQILRHQSPDSTRIYAKVAPSPPGPGMAKVQHDKSSDLARGLPALRRSGAGLTMTRGLLYQFIAFLAHARPVHHHRAGA